MIPQYVLIIGAMKSGTTTLYDYLARHPQLASSKRKEPGFFALKETGGSDRLVRITIHFRSAPSDICLRWNYRLHEVSILQGRGGTLRCQRAATF